MTYGNAAIEWVPRIAVVYFGLLCSGYDFFQIERSAAHIEKLKAFAEQGESEPFFSLARQNLCEVYPYWPRAFILEKAALSLTDDLKGFRDFGALWHELELANNIPQEDRGETTWRWLQRLPRALESVYSSRSFAEYSKWAKKWVFEQSGRCADELRVIEKCLKYCQSEHNCSLRKVAVCIDPIKCVYSSDYHIWGSVFIFSSGGFRTEAVIHELLHQVVHPAVLPLRDLILKRCPMDDAVDASYYFDGGDDGIVNAFEESAVRSLTQSFIQGEFPKDVNAFIRELLRKLAGGVQR